jgi:hypothetical protein
MKPNLPSLPIKPRRLALISVIIDLGLIGLAFFIYQEQIAIWGFAARWSGRVSLLFFAVLTAYLTTADRFNNRQWLWGFAIVHLTHWCILATNLYISQPVIVPIKLAGGLLAYALIVLTPFFWSRMHAVGRKRMQLFYFVWIWFVFLMTYISRVNGDGPTFTATSLEYSIWAGICVALLVCSVALRYLDQQQTDQVS